MVQKNLFFFLLFYAATSFAAETVDLYKAPLSSLKKFKLEQTASPAMQLKSAAKPNALKEINQTQEQQQSITRYQQLYKGIPVVGAQITIVSDKNQGLSAQAQLVNGHLIEDIQLNTVPALKNQEALDLAKKAYFKDQAPNQIVQEQTELQIRADEDNQLQLVYRVSFKTVSEEDKPLWPFFIVDAQTGAILQQWNNIKTYLDQGPGGNEKVHQYWYGKEGLPSLDVTQSGEFCIMDNEKVKLVNVDSAWDWTNLKMTAHQYLCNQNLPEPVNGAYSPANDAYYFGHTIVAMYRDWYGLNALQQNDGNSMKLIMRVHFGQSYDNAFWDGQAMSFGDGSTFYPLVSLDVAGHEVTHGFTEQHSALEYHDQSGALNESVSDMAGQASRAYLLETNPSLYAKAYLNPKEVTWGIGETIVRDSFGKALRFMDFPSSDGSSADCLDKTLARSKGAYCAISYEELVAFAQAHFPNPQAQQSFIVHTASGIFNKAFYLLSQKIGIKKAYQAMVLANTKYWTPNSDFKSAACGVLHAAQEISIETDLVHKVFGQVGIDTQACS